MIGRHTRASVLVFLAILFIGAVLLGAYARKDDSQ
jgi:hypothetical protein